MAEWHRVTPPLAQRTNKTDKWRCSLAICGHVWEANPSHRSPNTKICPEHIQEKGVVLHSSVAEGGWTCCLSGMIRESSCGANEVSYGRDRKGMVAVSTKE